MPKGVSYTERDMLKTAVEALASFLPGMMRRTSRMDGAELRALPGSPTQSLSLSDPAAGGTDSALVAPHLGSVVDRVG